VRAFLRALAVAAAAGALMALPASASAATVIGSDMGGIPVNTGCPAGCVVVQDQIAGEFVEAPERGVITEWTTRAAQGLMALRVYRHRDDVEFTPGELHAAEAGQSDDRTGNGGTQSFPTRIPVLAGDYIALVVAEGGAFGSRQAPPPETFAFRVGNFDVVDSTTPEALELYLQARVEPDIDADGFGDESQDPCVRCNLSIGPPLRPAPPTPDPYAAVRVKGPTVSMARRARASSRGVVPVKLTNPYAFELKGKLTLKVGKRKVGTKSYSLPAKASKPVKVKLKRSAFRRLKRRRSLRAVGDATVKAPAGPTRRVKKKLRLLAPKKKRQRRRQAPPTRGPGNANATFRGTTEQGFSITIRTSADGRALSTFATTATTASCLRGGSPVSQQTVNILPPVPIPLGADGSFAIDKRNEAEDYDPTYRVQGRLSGNTISGFFAWRRLKTFSNELCVTKELRFTATRS
jgi:hypothetical protein